MKAALIHELKGLDSILIEEIDEPSIQDGEVKIAVKAAGVNPIDWKIAEGLKRGYFDYRLPITLGFDCSGIVLESKNDTFKEGDRVYSCCFQPALLQLGTFCERVCLPAHLVSHMPTTLSFEEAASVPLAALTALQALKLYAKAEEVILIHAGAGGVGSFAIQIAKILGCKVVTTARSANHDYCKQLGADEVIDYETINLGYYLTEHYPDKIDGLFNTLKPELSVQEMPYIKKGGWLVSIVGEVDPGQADKHQVRSSFISVKPLQEQLDQIRGWIEEGRLVAPPIEKHFPLEKCAEALRLSRGHHVRGKLVITF